MDLDGSDLSILNFSLESIHELNFVLSQLMAQSGNEPAPAFAVLALPPLCKASALSV